MRWLVAILLFVASCGGCEDLSPKSHTPDLGESPDAGLTCGVEL